MIIELGKQYRTRDGREVRIYATDGEGDYPIHGAIKYENGWSIEQWQDDGIFYLEEGPNDLIEIRPRIKREVWFCVYDDYEMFFRTEVEAKQYAQIREPNACVKVVIDCEEGEGL